MKQKRKKHTHLTRVCLMMALVCVLLITGMVFGFQKYRQGILDVCANEQDGYVRLVLDQINLNADRSDDEIISDILSTLDDSSGRYWAFSEGENILFVKDVMETDKYKSVSADSYYDSDSARTFLHGLKLNNVKHAEIEVNGDKSLASGTSFRYGGKKYSLVLLSSEDVFLDNNAFLGAETSLITLIAAALVIMMVVPMVLAWREDTLSMKLNDSEEENVHLRRSLMKAGDHYLARQLYTDEGGIWNLSLLPEAISKLKEKGIKEAGVAVFRFESSEERNDFVKNAGHMIQEDFLCFGNDLEADLLFANQSEEKMNEIVKPLKDRLDHIQMYDLNGGAQ